MGAPADWPRAVSVMSRSLEARFASYREAVLAGETALAARALTDLLCSAPDEAIVLGDLLRSRGIPDEVRRELRNLGDRDATARRLLLGRLLELDPGDDDARRELAAFAGSGAASK